MKLNPKFIVDNKGERHSVVLSLNEYALLINQLEEFRDIKLYDDAKLKKETSMSFERYLNKRKKRD